jgi:CRISPR-associated protein Cas1
MELHVNTYGSYVHVRDNMFEIRRRVDNGEIEKKQFSSQKVTHLLLTTGTSLSTDAIKLAMRNNIDIVFIEQDGEPIGRVWHSKFGSTTRIRKAQLEASMSRQGVRYVKSWLLSKIDNQIDFIKDLKKHRSQHADYLNDKLARLESLRSSLSALEAERVSEIAEVIRGLEGTAGRLYFETLSHVLPRSYQFDGRSSRPAQDAFNAFLNYAYGILYSIVEKCLIIAGIDPYLGFLHRDDYNLLSMVYDFIEPYRIYAEEVVFRLFSGKKVNQTHTINLSATVGKPGVSLSPEGKALLIGEFSEFMNNKPIRFRGRNLCRSHCVQLEAHGFANDLVGKSKGSESS